MNVELSLRAAAELRSAIAFLESENSRAAERVRAAIERALDSLSIFPNRGRAGHTDGVRELVVRGAPYVLVYSVVGDGIFVVRIRHTSRDPSPD